MRMEAFLRCLSSIHCLNTLVFVVHIKGGCQVQIISCSFARMEDTQCLKLHYGATMAHQEVLQQQLNNHRFIRCQMRLRRGARACSIWVRSWVNPERRRQFDINDQLMVELRREYSQAFKKFMCMPVEIYDKIFERVRHRILKQYTWCREPLDPGLKLAATLRHFVSGAKYSDMQYS